MDIVPSCVQCGKSFTPRRYRQKYCPSCIEQSHICIDCGAIKHRSVRGPRCKACDALFRIANPPEKKPRVEKSIEQVMMEVEAFGLLPEKQYAFGYVIGVVFGDGCVSKVTNRIPHTRSDATVAYHDSNIYLIRLSVTSQAFAERFASQWQTLTNKAIKVWTSTRTDFSKSTLKGYSGQYKVQLFNVNPCHVLLGRYLAHLKYESELYELLRFPNEVIRGFIHGMIDAEGYVKAEYTDIANKNTKLLDVLVFMFERLGLKAIVYTSPSQSVAHLRTNTVYYKYSVPRDF